MFSTIAVVAAVALLLWVTAPSRPRRRLRAPTPTPIADRSPTPIIAMSMPEIVAWASRAIQDGEPAGEVHREIERALRRREGHTEADHLASMLVSDANLVAEYGDSAWDLIHDDDPEGLYGVRICPLCGVVSGFDHDPVLHQAADEDYGRRAMEADPRRLLGPGEIEA